jgi:hypothetical protein
MEGAYLYAVSIAVSMLSLIVGLMVWQRRGEQRELRERAKNLYDDMLRLRFSNCPRDIRQIGANADRIRAMARMNGLSLERLGVSHGCLQSMTDTMNRRLVDLSAQPTEPVGYTPADSWRFEDATEEPESDTEEIDTGDAESEPPMAPIAELLLEVTDNGTDPPEDEEPERIRIPSTFEQLFEGVTPGDIEGHIEENVELNRMDR